MSNMNSIILSFLLLSTTLYLVPIVAFSRSLTTFTSDNNHIVLPTMTPDDDDDDDGDYEEIRLVQDMDGEPLKFDEEYMIISALTGGGSVYLADLGNTRCPNGVAQHNSGKFEAGTPVKFLSMYQIEGFDSVYETEDISIMFSTPTSKLCVNETVWKVGDDFISPNPPPRFVVTGGTLGIPGPETIKNWFKIEKYVTERPNSYKLRYCPHKLICMDCDIDCAYVGLTFDSGHERLALNNKPFPLGFKKVNNTTAMMHA